MVRTRPARASVPGRSWPARASARRTIRVRPRAVSDWSAPTLLGGGPLPSASRPAAPTCCAYRKRAFGMRSGLPRKALRARAASTC
eukprot:11208386-Lingulodinium_polyedra.AAC.1